MHAFQAPLGVQLANSPTARISFTRAALPIHWPYRRTHSRSWRSPKTMRVKKSPRQSKLIPSGALKACRSHRWPLNEYSARDILKTFFKPLKTEDALFDFYTAYNKEASEFDIEYVKKYDEDLNTTLIFVRHLPYAPVNGLILPCRRACFLLLVQLSSSTSTNNFNQLPMIKQQPSFTQSSSRSTTRQSQTKLAPSKPSKRILLGRSSL